MKAVRIHEHGGIDKLRYEEVEEPKLASPTEAVVQLKAAALNRIDLLNRRGVTVVHPLVADLDLIAQGSLEREPEAVGDSLRADVADGDA